MEKLTVVYAIVNKVNGHRYIGSAVDFHARIRLHLHHLRTGKHHSRYLQRAFDKYGEESFDFVVLEHCNKKSLIDCEQKLIDLYDPEYNISPTARNSLGVKRTIESRLKVSEGLRAAWKSKELRERQRESHLGNVVTVEQRKKLSAALIGHSVSDDTRMKISSSQKGIPKSEESKQKMRDAVRKRRPQTEETKRKISETRKARYGKNKGS